MANLQQFLEAADLVKFAGVEATPEMADEATNSARTYLKTDAVEVSKEGVQNDIEFCRALGIFVYVAAWICRVAAFAAA